MTVGKKIQQAREKLNMTQEELEHRISVGTSVVSKIEHDKRDLKSTDIIELCNALHIKPNFLLGFEEVTEKEAIEKLKQIENILRN